MDVVASAVGKLPSSRLAGCEATPRPQRGWLIANAQRAILDCEGTAPGTPEKSVPFAPDHHRGCCHGSVKQPRRPKVASVCRTSAGWTYGFAPFGRADRSAHRIRWKRPTGPVSCTESSRIGYAEAQV